MCRRVLIALLVLGCSPQPKPAAAPALVQAEAASTLNATSACPPTHQAFTREELYFGLTTSSGELISAERFQAFVDTAITPRFPDGFTLFEASGQWRNPQGVVMREPTRVLVVLHEHTRDVSSELEQIISAYLRDFQQQAVLWENGNTCVRFAEANH
jgi:hypothetical protein